VKRTTKTTDEELARLRTRVDELQSLCAEAYQLAGEVGAPIRVLDRLGAACYGQPLPGDSFLPVYADECTVVAGLRAQLEQVRAIVAVRPAAAELGRLGGSRTSAAKRRAARANGRRGGRPRKTA
jgi:hypothetical protein